VKRLSYVLELLFLHTLAKFKKNHWRGFFAKSQNLAKIYQKSSKLPLLGIFREKGAKSKNNGRATFLTFFTPNFTPSFGKIIGAVSKIIRDGRRTDRRTHRPDFIGPFPFFKLGPTSRKSEGKFSPWIKKTLRMYRSKEDFTQRHPRRRPDRRGKGQKSSEAIKI
jgi:hypothetical protein